MSYEQDLKEIQPYIIKHKEERFVFAKVVYQLARIKGANVELFKADGGHDGELPCDCIGFADVADRNIIIEALEALGYSTKQSRYEDRTYTKNGYGEIEVLNRRRMVWFSIAPSVPKLDFHMHGALAVQYIYTNCNGLVTMSREGDCRVMSFGGGVREEVIDIIQNKLKGAERVTESHYRYNGWWLVVTNNKVMSVRLLDTVPYATDTSEYNKR